MSQGLLKTTQNNYLAENSKRGSFEFAEAGINFTTTPAEDLRIGLQIFARELGPRGNYTPRFDWFYLDYRFFDWLGIRAGRTKLPFGLYNETADIDAARVPVLLPQSVYPIENRDFLLAQTGGELYGNIELGGGGELEYRLYGGTLFFDPSEVENTTDTHVSVPYLAGARMMWQAPLEGLQLGGSAQTLRLDFDATPNQRVLDELQALGALPPDFSGILEIDIKAVLWVASVEYTAQELLVASEFSRWYTNVDTNLPNLAAEGRSTSDRFYVMASYRLAPWFVPGVYYSLLSWDADERTGRHRYQHDLAVTSRYDINANWLVKLEGHYMRGTAALSPDLNDGIPPATLAPDWGLFLLKTTAYF